MKKTFAVLAIAVLVISTYLTLSGSWITPDINRWQARMTGESKYFPALTIFILAIPPLLLLMGIKLLFQKKAVN